MDNQDHKSSLAERVRDIDANVTTILQLLQGNDLDKEARGMIGTQKDHEIRITAIEKLKDKVIYFIIGLSVFAGWGLFEIIQKLFLK